MLEVNDGNEVGHGKDANMPGMYVLMLINGAESVTQSVTHLETKYLMRDFQKSVFNIEIIYITIPVKTVCIQIHIMPSAVVPIVWSVPWTP